MKTPINALEAMNPWLSAERAISCFARNSAGPTIPRT